MSETVSWLKEDSQLGTFQTSKIHTIQAYKQRIGKNNVTRKNFEDNKEI